MLQRLAHFSYERRRLILLLWVAALIAVNVIGSSIGSSYSQSFSLPGTESQRATDLLQARFPARAGDSGQIVFSTLAGVRATAVEARLGRVFAAVAHVPGVTGVESPYATVGNRQVSTDGTVAYATVDFAERGNQITTQTKDAVENLAVAARGNGLKVELGGQMFESKPALGATELIGIIAAIIILLVVFGSVLAMGLPIMTALFGIGIGLAFVEMISRVLSTPNFAAELASMIGIGVGIDYALFIVTRYRQGLQEGLAPELAVVRAIDTAGRAVVFAGTTVMISVLGLYLMGVAFVQSLGAEDLERIVDPRFDPHVSDCRAHHAGIDHAPACGTWLRRAQHRQALGSWAPHPRDPIAPELLVPLESAGAAPTLARVPGDAGGIGRAGGSAVQPSSGIQRRRREPDERHDAASV